MQQTKFLKEKYAMHDMQNTLRNYDMHDVQNNLGKNMDNINNLFG